MLLGLCVLCSGGGRCCPRLSCVELRCVDSLGDCVTLAGFDRCCATVSGLLM